MLPPWENRGEDQAPPTWAGAPRVHYYGKGLRRATLCGMAALFVAYDRGGVTCKKCLRRLHDKGTD